MSATTFQSPAIAHRPPPPSLAARYADRSIYDDPFLLVILGAARTIARQATTLGLADWRSAADVAKHAALEAEAARRGLI